MVQKKKNENVRRDVNKEQYKQKKPQNQTEGNVKRKKKKSQGKPKRERLVGEKCSSTLKKSDKKSN